MAYQLYDTLNPIFQGSEWIRSQFQYGFDWYRESLGLSDTAFNILNPTITNMVTFFVVGTLYSLLDLLQWPKFLYQYKTRDVNITWQYIATSLKMCLINQIIVLPPVVIVFYYLGEIRGMDIGPRVPPLSTMFLHLVVCTVIVELGFFYMHRWFHSPLLYRKYHRIHHEKKTIQAFNVFYSHPMEYLCANICPVLLGPLVMGSHQSFISLWLIMMVAHGFNDHAGYHFPFCTPPEYHDYHHVKIRENYASRPRLDTWNGSNRTFFKTIFAKRYRKLYTFTPIRVLVPDENQQ